MVKKRLDTKTNVESFSEYASQTPPPSSNKTTRLNMSIFDFSAENDLLHDERMQHGLLHSGPTTAPQTYRERSEIPAVHHLSPSAAKHIKAQQHDKSISPTLSSDILRIHAEASDTELTPSTSSSRFSSQESIALGGRDRSLAVSGSVNSDALHALTSERPTETQGHPGHPGHPVETITASKRTSSGQIKKSSVSAAVVSSKDSHEKGSGRSRTASLLSNGTSVVELSQQLRSRLSYAMVKVQNGWESHTLEEITGLTSQHHSPRASLPAASPSVEARSLHSSNTVMKSNSRRQGSVNMSLGGVLAPGGTSYAVDRAQGEANHHHHPTTDGPQKRALAPPADIIPSTRRRPHHANPLLNGYRSVNSIRPPGSNQRTPSQNAAMEADAVETLLFMASPGNSGHHPSCSASGRPSQISAPTSSQPSPLTSEFPSRDLLLTSPRRRIVSTDLLPTNTPETVDLSCQIHDIDRMIDEMDDSSPDTDGRFACSNDEEAAAAAFRQQGS